MPNIRSTLSTKEKIAYGLGDAAANFVFQTQITFLMFFYTNVAGIAAGTAGTILLISRVLDAFNDPLVAGLADRTRTRWGRYRPWILWSAVPLAAALVLCYTVPPFGARGRIIWAITTYNLLMVVYAANNIPYCALSGVMTHESQERTRLASWRFVFAMGAALVVNVFTVDLVELFGRGDDALGYQLTMCLWGVLAVLFFVVTFLWTEERVTSETRQSMPFWRDVSDLLRNRAWLTLFAVAVLIYVQLALRSGTMLYYFRYYLQAPNVVTWIDNFGLFNGVGLICTLIGVVASAPLSSRCGKRETFRVCLFISSAVMAAFSLVPADAFATLIGLQVILHLVFGPTIPILWAMMADVADYAEWKTGHQCTALAFASIILGLKLGFGVGGWLNGALLSVYGYSTAQALSPSAIRGIVSMISVVPAVALFAAFCMMFVYQLNNTFVKQIEVALIGRRHETHKNGPRKPVDGGVISE
jgi:glycoside/pentoside/hexuronide:cation symporter, GPH family